MTLYDYKEAILFDKNTFDRTQVIDMIWEEEEIDIRLV